MALPKMNMKQPMTVGQLAAGGSVCTVTETASVKDAAKLMQERATDAVLVVGAGRRPLGLLTARDIVVRVTNAGRDAASVQAGTVMSAPLIAAGQHEDVGHAIALMVHKQVTHLPVLDGEGRVMSLFTLSDVLHLHLAGTVDLAEIATRLIELPEEQARLSVPPEPAVPSVPAPAEEEAGTGGDLPEGLESSLEFRSGGQNASSAAVSIPSSATKPVRTARPVLRASPVERHRRRTLVQKVQRAYFKNRGLTVIVSIIAVVVFFTGWLVMQILGLFDVYQASHYEPKDTERQQMLEKKQ